VVFHNNPQPVLEPVLERINQKSSLAALLASEFSFHGSMVEQDPTAQHQGTVTHCRAS
jgi:hypothetical protein